ncbi:hypothetical protein [Burkholderia sp. BCC0397]|uniref:hypothetical protein n=1 Tax=Burkholderia sp. BCC0397 TaxID=486876 RepID=UPI00158EF663|nr:hypothetical protein [Burkholderia sp. BCC0397]
MSNAGANGGKRGALFTIGGFSRRCEKIGGHIGGTQPSRNGATIAVMRRYSASVPECAPRVRCGVDDADTGLRG